MRAWRFLHHIPNAQDKGPAESRDTAATESRAFDSVKKNKLTDAFSRYINSEATMRTWH